MTTLLPLTPADADLQDFPFMPLHVARLRDSDLAAEEKPEACWYAVMLWAASWHQLPAGSLPNNDAVLCKLAGLGRDVRTWKKHRAGAMRGWEICTDGRFYHRVVDENVLEAWIEKLLQRVSSGAGNARRWNIEFDGDAIEGQIADAARLLRNLNPDSRTLAKLKRRQSRPASSGSPDVIPVGSQGTETGTGTGNNIEEEERAREISDLDRLLAAVAGPAGLSITDRRRAAELDRLADWLAKGHDLPAMLAAVDRTLRALPAGQTIGSLAKIERELFGQAAKVRALTPKIALGGHVQPVRVGDSPAVAAWRADVASSVGAVAYRSWLATADCAVVDDEFVITVPSPFFAAQIEANFRLNVERAAFKHLSGISIVRVVASTPSAAAHG